MNCLPLSAVVAVTPSWGIGESGTLPWKAVGVSLPGDMAYFRQMTTETIDKNKRNAILMGRRTWEGIPDKYKPLPNRLNIVLSNDQEFKYSLPKEVLSADNLENSISMASQYPDIERIVVIGGVSLFEETLFHQGCDSYHVTFIETEFPCDTFLTQKSIDKLKSMEPRSSSEPQIENGVKYRYIFKYFAYAECTHPL